MSVQGSLRPTSVSPRHGGGGTSLAVPGLCRARVPSQNHRNSELDVKDFLRDGSLPRGRGAVGPLLPVGQEFRDRTRGLDT